MGYQRDCMPLESKKILMVANKLSSRRIKRELVIKSMLHNTYYRMRIISFFAGVECDRSHRNTYKAMVSGFLYRFFIGTQAYRYSSDCQLLQSCLHR